MPTKSRDLSSLTSEDFESRQEDSFAASRAGSDPIALTLTSVDRGGHRSDRRDPFSLLFDGPASPVLPQGTHHLEHPTMGSLELFLVPIGADSDGVRYEAIFT